MLLSSEITFEENMKKFLARLNDRDYPATTVENHLSEVNFSDRKKALEQRNKKCTRENTTLCNAIPPYVA